MYINSDVRDGGPAIDKYRICKTDTGSMEQTLSDYILFLGLILTGDLITVH